MARCQTQDQKQELVQRAQRPDRSTVIVYVGDAWAQPTGRSLKSDKVACNLKVQGAAHTGKVKLSVVPSELVGI